MPPTTRTYAETPDWIDAGDPITGDSGNQQGVANQVARQLADSLDTVRRSALSDIRPSIKTITVPTGGGDAAAAGDFFVVDTAAATRINLPAGPSAGDQVRVKRLVKSGSVAVVEIYEGANRRIGAAEWPVAANPGAAVHLAGRSIDRIGAGDTLDDADDVLGSADVRRSRVDDITITWDGSAWNWQPSILVDPSAGPLLRLLASLRHTVNQAITNVVSSGSFDTSVDARIDAKVNGLQSIWLCIETWMPKSTNGADPAVNGDGSVDRPDLPVYAFDDTVTEHIECRVKLPKKWKRDDNLKAQVYWTAESTSTGSVRWGIRCARFGNDETVQTGTPYGALVEVTDAHGGSNTDLNISEGDPYTTGFNDGTADQGDMLFLQVRRTPSHASDTLSGDAQFIGLELFFETDAATDD